MNYFERFAFYYKPINKALFIKNSLTLMDKLKVTCEYVSNVESVSLF